MPERERSRARAALSRLPRWATALGLILVLIEAGGAALFVADSESGASSSAGTAASSPRPGMRTVTLRVGGLALGDTLDYETPAGRAAITRTPYLTFTKNLRVRSGGLVTIHAFTSRHDPVTCSIASNGKLLLQSSANQSGADSCQARVP